MDELYELKDKLMKELKEYAGNGKFSKEDVESIKYITSSIDHICNIAEGEEGYSGYYPMMGRAYNDGMENRSYRGSYARKRDSMGRYSGERGYARDGLADKLRELMDEAPDEHIRMEIKRLVDKM